VDNRIDGDPVIPVDQPRRQCECGRETVFPWYIFERLRLLAAYALYLWVIWTTMNIFHGTVTCGIGHGSDRQS
jgi:hypothetical protein